MLIRTIFLKYFEFLFNNINRPSRIQQESVSKGLQETRIQERPDGKSLTPTFHHRGTKRKLVYVVEIPRICSKRFASKFIQRTAKECNFLPADIFSELGPFQSTNEQTLLRCGRYHFIVSFHQGEWTLKTHFFCKVFEIVVQHAKQYFLSNNSIFSNYN